MRRPYPLQYFPALSSENHTVESPESEDYNCVAWAAGYDDRQVWPGDENCEWPHGLPTDETMGSFVAFFESMGYLLCDSPAFEQGCEKIAIYGDEYGPTHVSRQLPTGMWASKMGWDGVDIEHNSLHCIEGDRYGTAQVFLVRTIDR